MTIVQVDPWLRLATLAPSPLNTQPWRFRVTPAAIDLLTDPTRALPVSDPDGRERTIAGGCALLNLRAAGARADCDELVTPLPDPAEPELLARIVLAEGTPDRTLAGLTRAIESRRSTRYAFHPHPLPPGLLDALAAEAAAEGAHLIPITRRTDREALAALIAEADRRLYANRAWRHEIAHWIHPGRSNDGLSAHRFGGYALRFLVDHFDFGATTAFRDEVYALHAPAVLLLATTGDEPHDWLRAGQALQRLLLRAALEDVHAGYLQQPLQLPDVRERVAATFTPGLLPQVCLRLGHPVDERPPRRRRPPSEVSTFAFV
jgi:nitroreductase